jgi:ribonuclease HII
MEDSKYITSWKQKPGLPYSESFMPHGLVGPLICGVDEAGRGPLAGPVVAAAVVLCDGFDTDGIADSKRLTPAQRQRQRERLIGSPCLWGIGVVGHQVIDEVNILQATFLAMQQAIEALGIEPEIVLVDGCQRIPGLLFRQQAIIDGDALEPCISAASILAKTYRDELMMRYSERYPHYGFEKHKGYATLEHLTKIFQYGPCPIHRRSFHPVSTYYPKSDEAVAD